MRSDSKNTALGFLPTALRWTTIGGGHLLGTVAIFILSWMALIPSHTRQALYEAYQEGLILTQWTDLAFHLALSACAWALLFIVFKLLSTPAERKPRLVRARGTVVTETLIVFPIFLLLTLGLFQLILVNTAALLTSLAAFKAGRAVAVWAPEIGERNGVDRNLVLDKARVAAAGALAPVAPSDFVYNLESCSGYRGDTIEPRLEALGSVGHVSDINPGALADGNRPNLTVARAFDTSNFMVRGQRKFGFAYCATQVDYQNSGGTIQTQVRYMHQMAMPIVEVVFGTYEEVGGRTAFYSEIYRDHTVTPQIDPRESPPGYNVGSLLNGLF